MTTWRQRLANWVAGTPSAAPAAPASGPVRAKVSEALGVTIDPDEDQWRPITGDARRDLTPLTQQRMRELACYLWESNLLANRLVELPAAFILGEGVRLTCPDQEHQAWLDAFWRDPVNEMDLALPEFVRALSIHGEQCYPEFADETGRVRLGYLDPEHIEQIVMDPDNPRRAIGVVTCPDKKGQRHKYRVIVNADEDQTFTARTQAIRANDFRDGECFYFRVNALAGGKRGRSDLLAPADWCDLYEQYMFGAAEYANHMRAFVWDVTLAGATKDEVKDRAKQIGAPKPGSVRVHNDAETWAAVTPDLKAVDTGALASLFRNHILGGLTIPEHWYGGGGDVNRAVGAEMLEPTAKVFAQRQRVWKHILEHIGRRVLWRKAVAAGETPDWSDQAWQVQAAFPEMIARDVTKYAAALQQVVTACALAVGEGYLSEQTAVRIIAGIASRLGIDIDPKQELAAAQAERAARREADVFRDPPDPEDGDDAARNPEEDT